MMQSNCCGARSTYHVETDLCPDCFEHCEWEEVDDEYNGYQLGSILLERKRKPLNYKAAIITLAFAIGGLLIFGYIDDVWSTWR